LNQSLSVYACTDKISSLQWEVKTLFTISKKYSTAGGFTWQAALITTTPKGTTYLYKTIPATSPLTAYINTYVNPKVSTELAFSYEAGTPVKGGTTALGNVSEGGIPALFAKC
jgi:hypothetical protein